MVAKVQQKTGATVSDRSLIYKEVVQRVMLYRRKS